MRLYTTPCGPATLSGGRRGLHRRYHLSLFGRVRPQAMLLTVSPKARSHQALKLLASPLRPQRSMLSAPTLTPQALSSKGGVHRLNAMWHSQETRTLYSRRSAIGKLRRSRSCLRNSRHLPPPLSFHPPWTQRAATSFLQRTSSLGGGRTQLTFQ